MTARGVMKIIPNETFNVLIATVKERSVYITQAMKIALATDMQGNIVHLGDLAKVGKGGEVCKVKVCEHLDFKGKLGGTV